MNQLTSRRNRDMLHYDEVEWTSVFRPSQRVFTDTEMSGRNCREYSNTDTILGAVYVGVLIVLMLVYLT